MNRRGVLVGFFFSALATAKKKQPFAVFDALEYIGKPVLQGTVPMTYLRAPPPAGATGTYYIDDEPDLTLLTDVQAMVGPELAKISSYRLVAPSVGLGCYGLAPISVFWPFVDPTGTERGSTNNPDIQATLATLQAANDLVRPLAVQSDWLFPSLYNHYENSINWWVAAIGNINEARRISSTPVAPFVTPRYQTPGNGYIEADVWTKQLGLIKASCDGIVLWGGFQAQWDPNAAWWLATRSVLGIG
jgi:hypothetical protein